MRFESHDYNIYGVLFNYVLIREGKSSVPLLSKSKLCVECVIKDAIEINNWGKIQNFILLPLKCKTPSRVTISKKWTEEVFLLDVSE